jgi:hypothetical protein
MNQCEQRACRRGAPRTRTTDRHNETCMHCMICTHDWFSWANAGTFCPTKHPFSFFLFFLFSNKNIDKNIDKAAISACGAKQTKLPSVLAEQNKQSCHQCLRSKTNKAAISACGAKQTKPISACGAKQTKLPSVLAEQNKQKHPQSDCGTATYIGFCATIFTSSLSASWGDMWFLAASLASASTCSSLLTSSPPATLHACRTRQRDMKWT